MPVESASQTVCINAHGTKTGIPPPRKVGGKRGTRSKHQTRPGNEIWGAGPHGMGQLNLRRETKFQFKNGDRKRRIMFIIPKKGYSWRANGGSEVEQSGASCDRPKQGIELVCVDRRSQLPRTTYERRWWMGPQINGEC